MSKVQENIENSNKKYKENKRKSKEYSDNLKRGRKFFRDNLTQICTNINDLYIDIGYRFNSDKSRIEYQIAVCSETDSYSSRLGRGLIGMRFLNENYIALYNPMKNKSQTKTYIIADMIKTAIECNNITGPFYKIRTELGKKELHSI